VLNHSGGPDCRAINQDLDAAGARLPEPARGDIMAGVPFLVDGNNLLHALAGAGVEVGRSGLCRLLGGLAGEGQVVRVVFDGRCPRGDQVGAKRVEAIFSHPRTADEVIADLVAANTAPRRLTVVSTDRAIRRSARRRRCRTVTSEAFSAWLGRRMRRPRRAEAVEPPEKTAGLTPEQTRAWLRELALEDADKPIRERSND
jgi:hypothetical protein